jgi:hypothetical protein
MNPIITNKENSSDGLTNEIFYKQWQKIYSGFKNKLIEIKFCKFEDFNISNLIIPFLNFSKKKRKRSNNLNCSEKINSQLREILIKELE